jgi:hypothetical protein
LREVRPVQVKELIMARGRNGMFRAKYVSAWKGCSGTCYVEVRSKRSGRSAPVLFQGKKRVLVTLFKTVTKSLETLSD